MRPIARNEALCITWGAHAQSSCPPVKPSTAQCPRARVDRAPPKAREEASLNCAHRYSLRNDNCAHLCSLRRNNRPWSTSIWRCWRQRRTRPEGDARVIADWLRACDAEGRTGLCGLVGHVVAKTFDQEDQQLVTQRPLLAPILEQDEIVCEMRLAQSQGPDNDPATGDEVEPEDEDCTCAGPRNREYTVGKSVELTRSQKVVAAESVELPRGQDCVAVKPQLSTRSQTSRRRGDARKSAVPRPLGVVGAT